MPIKLSICIATFKRGAFIAQTLDSIIEQIAPNVEIVVVDGASPDNTPEVLAGYTSKYPFIHYYRESENSGVDGDYDKCVSYAQGEYCWLMTDDDLMLDGAIKSVLAQCNSVHELVVVNASVRDYTLTNSYNEKLLAITQDTLYNIETMHAFYSDCIRYLSFIGGVIVKKSFWLSRDRQSYYGTAFIHIGVLLQQPAPASISVMATPLIAIRYGNAMWKPQTFNIWMNNWPKLINSFTHLPNDIVVAITQSSFINEIKNLIIYRAQGYYSYQDYKSMSPSQHLVVTFLKYLVAIMPIKLTNATLAIAILLVKPKAKMLMHDLKSSKYATLIAKQVANKLGAN